MKKIGFIDYYLDEWHANNYPEFIKKYTKGLEVVYAYGKIDSPNPGGLTSKEWGEKYGVTVCDTMEEVIEKSDFLLVLSPDNPEMHEELCRLPLQSGKLTYIDKTFAETKASAETIFQMAEEGNTNCYSSSALFFAQEYASVYEKEVVNIDSCGPGKFPIYVIHQLEPIVAMLKAKPVRAMSVGTQEYPAVIVEFEGGKRAKVATFYMGGKFSMNIGYANGEAELVVVDSNFWEGFIKALAVYFETGVIPVPHENTVNVIAAREIAIEALEKPFEWVYVK